MDSDFDINKITLLSGSIEEDLETGELSYKKDGFIIDISPITLSANFDKLQEHVTQVVNQSVVLGSLNKRVAKIAFE